jgi:hypothetical protein
MTTEIIPVSVDTHAVISRSDRLFDQKPGTIVNEIAQNAYRVEGCTEMRIYVHPEEKAVTFTNNGKLVEDFRDLFRLGGSNWDHKVVEEQDPAGMGFFSLVTCDKVQISSGDRRVEFQGRQLTDPDTRLEVTTCEFESCTRLKVWNEALYQEFTFNDVPVKEFSSYSELRNLPFFPLGIFLEDRHLNKDFFAQFKEKGVVIKAGEIHPGCLVQVCAPGKDGVYGGYGHEAGKVNLCWHGNVLALHTKDIGKWALAEMVEEDDNGHSETFDKSARESWLWLADNLTVNMYSTSNPWGAQLKLPDRQTLVQSDGTKAMLQEVFKFVWKSLEQQCDIFLKAETPLTMSPWVTRQLYDLIRNNTLSPRLWCHLANLFDKRLPVRDVTVKCYEPPQALQQRADCDSLDYTTSQSFSKASMKALSTSDGLLFLDLSKVTPLAFPILNTLCKKHWLVGSGNIQMLRELEFLPEEGGDTLMLETAKIQVDGHDIALFAEQDYPGDLEPHEEFDSKMKELFQLSGDGDYHHARSFAISVRAINMATGNTRTIQVEGAPGGETLGTHVFNATSLEGEEDGVDCCIIYAISDDQEQETWSVEDIAEEIMRTVVCVGYYKYDDDGNEMDAYGATEAATKELVEHLTEAGYGGYDLILQSKIKDGIEQLLGDMPGKTFVHGSLLFAFQDNLLVLEMGGRCPNVREATEAEREKYDKMEEA